MSDILDTSQFITGEWRQMPISYNTRDLLIYAVSIGCGNETRTGNDSNHSDLRYIYEQRENFSMFPTFPLVLSGKGVSQDIDVNISSDWYLGKNRKPRDPNAPQDKKPKMKLKGVKTGVDAERYVVRVKNMPLKAIDGMYIRSRMIGVHKKGPGALTETEDELCGPDGTVYYRFVGGGLSIGAHSFSDSGTTNSENFDPPNRAPDMTTTMITTPEQAHMYRLNSDYNPLHIDPQDPGVPIASKPARTVGPILHGLCTLGISARGVLSTAGANDPNRFHALKVRFASPVIPGDTLVIKMWKLPDADANKMIVPLVPNCERVVFTTEVESTKKVVVSNSYMDILKGPESRL